MFLFVFIRMIRIPQYKIFAKNVLECKNLYELKEVVKKINQFNKENSIRSSSDDFRRLETYVALMKIKLRSKQGINESSILMVEQFNPDKLYPKDYILKVLQNAPREFKYLKKQLSDIPCINGNGIQSVCTKIPEILHVYLTGRY